VTEPTAFRRAFTDHGTVCVETGPGEVWYLPNGQDGAPRYDCQVVFERVRAAKAVNLDRWRRMR
jgi:hypothetical protein